MVDFSGSLRKAHTATKVGAVLLFVAGIFASIATNSDYWVYISKGTLLGATVSNYYGLWRYCGCVGSICACESIYTSVIWDGFRGGIQANVLIGDILIVIGLVLVFCSIFGTTNQCRFRGASIGVTVGAGIQFMVAAIIFAANDDNKEFHYSFYMCIITCIACFVVVFVFGYGHSKAKTVTDNSVGTTPAVATVPMGNGGGYVAMPMYPAPNGMQQGQYGMQQGQYGMQQSQYGMQQGPYGMQQGQPETQQYQGGMAPIVSYGQGPPPKY